MYLVTGIKQKRGFMLECNKNYVILALNYVLKILKGTISASGINRRSRKNDIKEDWNI